MTVPVGCANVVRSPERPHGEPEWTMTALCVHEHLTRERVCSQCREFVERWQRTQLEPPGPWCGECYVMRPGGHHCTSVPEFVPLSLG